VLPGELGYHLHAQHLAFMHPHNDQRIKLFCISPPLLRPIHLNA